MIPRHTARNLAALHKKAIASRDQAEAAARGANALLSSLHSAAEARFGCALPRDPELLDVLAQVDIEPGDVWRWRGHHNNLGHPTIRFRKGEGKAATRTQHERSVVRWLALRLGVIEPDEYGLLYPTGDPLDINPSHRTLRRSPEPMRNHRLHGKGFYR